MLAAITGWVWIQMVGAVKSLKTEITTLHEKIANMGNAHSEYKLAAEQRFAKDAEVKNQFEQLHVSQKSIEKDINDIKIAMNTIATVMGTQTSVNKTS